MTLDEKIADVEDKLHALYTGTGIVQVDVGDGAGAYRTTFNRANVQQLEAYLARLKLQLAGADTGRGAIGFVL